MAQAAMIPRAGTSSQQAALARSGARRKAQKVLPGVTPPVTSIPKAVSGPSGLGPTGYTPPPPIADPGRGPNPPPPMTTSNAPTFYTPGQQAAAAPANVTAQPGSPATLPAAPVPPATPALPATPDFMSSPLYKFQLEEGQKALNAKLSSLGLSDSGASLQATKDFVGKLGAEEAARAEGVKERETARQDDLKQAETDRLRNTEEFNWDNLYRFLGLTSQQSPQPDNVAATGQAASLATTEGKTKGDFALKVTAKERSNKRRKEQKKAKTKADTKAAV